MSRHPHGQNCNYVVRVCHRFDRVAFNPATLCPVPLVVRLGSPGCAGSYCRSSRVKRGCYVPASFEASAASRSSTRKLADVIKNTFATKSARFGLACCTWKCPVIVLQNYFEHPGVKHCFQDHLAHVTSIQNRRFSDLIISKFNFNESIRRLLQHNSEDEADSVQRTPYLTTPSVRHNPVILTGVHARGFELSRRCKSKPLCGDSTKKP